MDNTPRAFFSDILFYFGNLVCARGFYIIPGLPVAVVQTTHQSSLRGLFTTVALSHTHMQTPLPQTQKNKNWSLTTKSSCFHWITRADAHGSQSHVINTFSISKGLRMEFEKMTKVNTCRSEVWRVSHSVKMGETIKHPLLLLWNWVIGQQDWLAFLGL